MEPMLLNPGQPAIEPDATGDVVRRLLPALRRHSDLEVSEISKKSA